ncbi:hypothetical protein Xoosp13_212 [Xanthomonas phage Xoo-sp13]|nr:hypothetical protein Xoosp13_212 [Xanthomonas phage Xoo-sp13]
MDDLKSVQKELASLRSEVDSALREKDREIKTLRAKIADMEKHQRSYNLKTDNYLKKIDTTLSTKIEVIRRALSHLTQQTNGLENRLATNERDIRRKYQN